MNTNSRSLVSAVKQMHAHTQIQPRGQMQSFQFDEIKTLAHNLHQNHDECQYVIALQYSPLKRFVHSFKEQFSKYLKKPNLSRPLEDILHSQSELVQTYSNLIEQSIFDIERDQNHLQFQIQQYVQEAKLSDKQIQKLQGETEKKIAKTKTTKPLTWDDIHVQFQEKKSLTQKTYAFGIQQIRSQRHKNHIIHLMQMDELYENVHFSLQKMYEDSQEYATHLQNITQMYLKIGNHCFGINEIQQRLSLLKESSITIEKGITEFTQSIKAQHEQAQNTHTYPQIPQMTQSQLDYIKHQ